VFLRLVDICLATFLFAGDFISRANNLVVFFPVKTEFARRPSRLPSANAADNYGFLIFLGRRLFVLVAPEFRYAPRQELSLT
jgi:hypothetical protein